MADGIFNRRSGAIVAAVAVGALGALGLAAYGRARAEDDEPPLLGQPEQLEREAIAVRLMRSRAMQAELALAKAAFAASDLAHSSSARATIDRASEAIAFQAALYAANYDTVEPFILWSTNAAHRWSDLDVPSSGYALDCPDNVYRHATLDGAGRYVVRGRFHGEGPAQQTFVIYRSIPGVSETMTADGHMDEIGGIKSEDIVRDADGGYTLTIDADPANGRTNHLQVRAELSHLHLMVRDSLADWSRELPVELSIRRLDPVPDAAARSDAEMAQLAAGFLKSMVPYWLKWFEGYVHAKPLNEIVPPWKRVQGWGMTQQGRFAFADDEAWLITLDPLDARFFDMQISDPWTKAVEYVTRTGSFNGSQPIANDDGTVTMVACPRDPGIHNWLDTGGLTAGTFQARWQSLPEGTTGEGAVREARVVKLKDLRGLLPPETAWVTARGRARQLRHRRRAYANRLR